MAHLLLDQLPMGLDNGLEVLEVIHLIVRQTWVGKSVTIAEALMHQSFWA